MAGAGLPDSRITMTAKPRPRLSGSLRWGLILSLLLHLAFVSLVYPELLPDFERSPPEKTMEVELVKEPEPKPKPEQKPETKPEPKPEQKPEPEPKPEPKPEPPPPPQKPKPEPPKPKPALVPPPQLERGAIADKSSAPKPSTTGGISFESRPSALPAGELSQTTQDFILAQIIKMWRFDFAAGKGRNFGMTLLIHINRDGTLTDGLHKNAPWNPQSVIRDYDQLPDGYVKRAMESMLLALKMAQPLELPPDDGKGWPRRMVLRFRFDDL